MQLRNWDGIRQSRDDIHRKFNHTYLYAVVPEYNEKPVTIWISDFDTHSCRVLAFPKGQSEPHRNTIIAAWETVDVQMAFPPTGAIPFGKTVQFVTRQPARQWQVGWCGANSAIFTSTLAPTRINNDFARDAFTPEYSKKPLDEVLKDFTKDKELDAWAISHRYWLKRTGDNTVVLYRNRVPIGSFSMGSFFINKLCADFKQELWDDLRIKVR